MHWASYWPNKLYENTEQLLCYEAEGVPASLPATIQNEEARSMETAFMCQTIICIEEVVPMGTSLVWFGDYSDFWGILSNQEDKALAEESWTAGGGWYWCQYLEVYYEIRIILHQLNYLLFVEKINSWTMAATLSINPSIILLQGMRLKNNFSYKWHL